MPLLKVICGPQESWTGSTASHYHDDDARTDVIAYCLNPRKTPSGYVGGCAVNVNQAAFEMDLLARAYGKENGLRLRHMVLSFSDQEMRKLGGRKHGFSRLNQIAQYAIAYYGNEYQIIYAVHEDSDHGHIHIVMTTVNYRTGKKYGGQKADYYRFQRYLGSFLKDPFGIYIVPAS